MKIVQGKFFPTIRTSNPSPINQMYRFNYNSISLNLTGMKIPLDDEGITLSNFRKNCNKVQKNIKKDGNKTSRSRFRFN